MPCSSTFCCFSNSQFLQSPETSPVAMEIQLPEDILLFVTEAVIGDDDRLERLSLVSKKFLLLTNHLRSSLTITDSNAGFIASLFHRFTNLKKVGIHMHEYNGDFSALLRQISRFVKVESLTIPMQLHFPVFKNLGWESSMRVLDCSRILSLTDKDIYAIVTAFPRLTNLNVSRYCPVRHAIRWKCDDGEPELSSLSNHGILHLLRLGQLHSIDLSGNLLLTDASIFSLSNLLELREVILRGCMFTAVGLGSALIKFQNLSRFSVLYRSEDISQDKFFQMSFHASKKLSEIEFNRSPVTHDLLLSVATAGLPLRKLVICDWLDWNASSNYTGIYSLLNSYRDLVTLQIEHGYCLTDMNIVQISQFLIHIRELRLSYCSQLTTVTFVTILKNCHHLTSFEMMETHVGAWDSIVTTDVMNLGVRNLIFSVNKELCNQFLELIATACPELQKLSIAECSFISIEGINAVLRSCHNLIHLDISECEFVVFFNLDIQVPNLECLIAKGLEFFDDALMNIGVKCSGLKHLDIENCRKVTALGVVQFVQSCNFLREINLSGCRQLDAAAIVAIGEASSPLHWITLPENIKLSHKQNKKFWSRGCHLSYEA